VIFSKICRELSDTSSKKEKVEILRRYLSTMEAEEREVLILLLLSKIKGYTFRIVKNALGDFTLFYKGDVYEAVKEHLEKSAWRQRNLLGRNLDMVDVVRALKSASKENKELVLKGLVSSLDPEDVAFLISSLLNDLRVGVKEGLIWEAMAKVCGREYRKVKTFIGLTSLRELVRCRFSEGIKPFSPFSPMLAEKAENFDEIILKGNIWAERKLDGIRILVHKKDGKIRIFSRRGKDITTFFPEIVEYASQIGGNYVLDGEVVARKEDRILPFQSIMRRFSERRNVTIDFFFFDIPYYNGSLINENYEKRRGFLESITEKYVMRRKIEDADSLKSYFEKEITKGYEGLVCKHPQGKYYVGERSALWLKIKRIFEVDAVIVAAEWGHGRRKKWLSVYHLALWKDDSLVEVGKTFKGLKDQEMEYLTRKLLELKISDMPGGINIIPKIVVEVEFEDVQISPIYERYTLRFARIKRIREDKSVEEAGKLEEIEKVYKKLHSEG